MQKTIFKIMCLSALMTTATIQQSFAKNCTRSLTTTCYGTNSADTLTGNGKANRISGQSGNDLLRGGAGGDALSGDQGDDTLYGQDGDDYFVGGSGIDTFNGGKGSDKFAITTGDTTETAMKRIEDFTKSEDTIQIYGKSTGFVQSIDQLQLDPVKSKGTTPIISRGAYILRSKDIKDVIGNDSTLIDNNDNFAIKIQQVGSDTDDSTVPTGATLKIEDIKFEFVLKD